MNAIAALHRWPLSVEALSSQLSADGLKWSSGGAAVLLHLGLGAAALFLMQQASHTPPVAPQAVNVTLFTPAVAEPPVVTAPQEDEVSPTPVDPAPAPRTEPAVEAPAETVSAPETQPAAPVSEPGVSAPPAGSAPQPQQVLTAEGGEAGWAPDAGPAVNERTAGALRGILCAGGSEHTRAAAGCDPTAQTDPNGYVAYASADEIARIEAAYGPVESLGYAGGSTVNLGSFDLPGQVNNNQPHYLSGAHAAFGRLPVSDKNRDPGFGD